MKIKLFRIHFKNNFNFYNTFFLKQILLYEKKNLFIVCIIQMIHYLFSI